jgi:hypothetical protein
MWKFKLLGMSDNIYPLGDDVHRWALEQNNCNSKINGMLKSENKAMMINAIRILRLDKNDMWREEIPELEKMISGNDKELVKEVFLLFDEKKYLGEILQPSTLEGTAFFWARYNNNVALKRNVLINMFEGDYIYEFVYWNIFALGAVWNERVEQLIIDKYNNTKNDKIKWQCLLVLSVAKSRPGSQLIKNEIQNEEPSQSDGLSYIFLCSYDFDEVKDVIAKGIKNDYIYAKIASAWFDESKLDDVRVEIKKYSREFTVRECMEFVLLKHGKIDEVSINTMRCYYEYGTYLNGLFNGILKLMPVEPPKDRMTDFDTYSKYILWLEKNWSKLKWRNNKYEIEN